MAWNTKNPAVRRIMQEIKELEQEHSTDFVAEALEDDIFEFAFVVRGPPDTEFEGGLYHGRILLPAEYPFKPPSFMMLTPSGRFQTSVKICLSISSHHPEHWQPSWSVRTALTALVAFMPSPGAGALGSLDYTKEERQQLAAKSRLAPPKVASASRQRVIDGLHARMLELEAAARAAGGSGSGGGSAEAPGDALRRMRAEVEAAHGGGSGDGPAAERADAQRASGGSDQAAPRPAEAAAKAAKGAEARGASDDVHSGASHDQQLEPAPAPAPAAAATAASELHRRRPSPGAEAPEPASAASPPSRSRAPTPSGAAAVAQLRLQQQQAPADRGLTLLAVLLSVAIAMMLLRKIAAAFGGGGRLDALMHASRA